MHGSLKRNIRHQKFLDIVFMFLNWLFFKYDFYCLNILRIHIVVLIFIVLKFAALILTRWKWFHVFAILKIHKSSNENSSFQNRTTWYLRRSRMIREERVCDIYFVPLINHRCSELLAQHRYSRLRCHGILSELCCHTSALLIEFSSFISFFFIDWKTIDGKVINFDKIKKWFFCTG